MLTHVPLKAIISMAKRLITHPIPETEPRREGYLYVEPYGRHADICVDVEKIDDDSTEEHGISLPIDYGWVGYDPANIRSIQWYVDTGYGPAEGLLQYIWIDLMFAG